MWTFMRTGAVPARHRARFLRRRFCKVNIDDDPQLAERFGVSHVPTMLVMNGEKIYKTIQGFHPLEEILEYLEM